MRIWDEALIVLDTNVILNLYRLPATARDELLTVLESFKERLWLPFHVALEFQRNRLTVISAERKTTEDVLDSARELVKCLSKQVASLQIDKHGLGLEPQPLLDGLQRANDKLVESVEAVHKAQLDIASSDPIRDRLDIIFTGRIGAGPVDQAELDGMIADGETRYLEKIAPGWADANKDKNPSEAHFFNAGIKYPRKFGDLIIWRQLLAHVKKSENKTVLLITADQKDDWWWREKGKTIGPRPDLIDEMRRLASANLFWMYSDEQFLEHAQRYSGANISENTLSELREVTMSNVRDLNDIRLSEKSAIFDGDWYKLASSMTVARAESCVFEWIRRHFEIVTHTQSFPDFIVQSEVGLQGFEVKRLFHNLDSLFSMVTSALQHGYSAITNGILAQFTFVVVTMHEDNEDNYAYLSLKLNEYIGVILENFPKSSVIIGEVTQDAVFRPIRFFKGNRFDERGIFED